MLCAHSSVHMCTAALSKIRFYCYHNNVPDAFFFLVFCTTESVVQNLYYRRSLKLLLEIDDVISCTLLLPHYSTFMEQTLSSKILV